MANRRLTSEELIIARELLEGIRNQIIERSGGDIELLFALRRKIFKELTYDERSSPAFRKKLKAMKFAQQKGICPICNETLPKTYAVLDRFNAIDGYNVENTRLIHSACDTDIQKSRSYS